MDRDDVIETLNDLIETSKDGEKGFKQCAENTQNAELKAVFNNAAARCTKAIQDLQQAVRQFGADPESSGTLTGKLHRGWIDLKTAITSNDDLAILQECERGEDAALSNYRDALEEDDLPSDIRQLIEAQYQGVLENHNRIRDLRDRYKAAAD